MAGPVSHFHVTTEAQLCLQVSAYGICSVQSGTGAAFLLSTSIFIISVTSTFIVLNSLLMAWMGHKMLDILKVAG